MHEAQGVGSRGKSVARQQFRGQRVAGRRGQAGQRGMDHPPDHARADAANGFVDGNDAADFRRVDGVFAKQLVLRIDHFDAAGPVGIDLGFAVDHHALSRAKAFFEVLAVKEFARQRAGFVAHQQVIDRAPSSRVTNQPGIGHHALHRVRFTRHDLANLAEVDAVFVAKRQVAEQIADAVNPARFQQGGALRPNAFQVFDFRAGAQVHRTPIYITVIRAPPATCIPRPPLDRLSEPLRTRVQRLPSRRKSCPLSLPCSIPHPDI